MTQPPLGPAEIESRPMLGKMSAFWRKPSRVGSPLPAEAQAQAQAIAELDLARAPLGMRSLHPACDALGELLPPGMSLRAVGSAAGDRQALFDHWMGLGAEGMRSRFFYPPSEAFLRRRAFDMSFENPAVAGVFAPDGSLACVGEWALDPEAPGEAEAAFSTLDAHRRRGLAKIAAAACAIDARERGVATLRIDTLRDNGPAQGLAASLGAAKPNLPSEWGESISSRIDLSAGGPRAIERRLGLREHSPLSKKNAAP
jgi:GNAT superfamily N-acetyltransferase